MSTISQLRERSAPRVSVAGSRLLSVAAGARRKLAPVILAISGLTCLSAAAFQVNTAVGLVATGISAFVLEWRIHE